MNKRTGLLLLFCSILTMMAGCGSANDPVIGVWSAKEAHMGALEMDFSTYAEQAGKTVKEIETRLEFNQDKTVLVTLMGKAYSGSWKQEKGTYLLDVNELDLQVSLTGDAMMLTESSLSTALLCEKE